MGIDVPDLDDRTYADILEDARKLLPVYTDEWTDHNAHDPGITFLELFAWLAETYTYQLDRVTERHVEKYLELVGVRPRPPTPAVARLHLEAPAGREGDEVVEGEQLTVDDGEGFVGVFETTKPVTLTRTRVEGVVSVHDGTVTDNSTANDTYGMYFLAFGETAGRGSAMYVGFDGDPFTAADIVDLTVDYHDDDLPASEAHELEDPAFDPSVDLAWQFCPEFGDGAWRRDDGWRDFDVRRDQTDRLYRGGTVALERTEEWTGAAGEILDRPGALVWIRCVVTEPGYEVPPPLDSLHLDVVPARHRASHAEETLRRVEDDAVGEQTETTARPGQTFAFEHAPVLEADVTVGGERWTEVRDFDAAAPDAGHYVLDRAAGRLRFGDGVRGRVPAAGQRVVAETYTHGGGASGNVPRSAACTFVRDALGDVAVTLEDDAEGGADAESVDEALVRAREDLAKPYRAVTLADYRYVTTATPGLRFGRATAQVRRRERDADGAVRDEVRVVVVPYSTRSRPEPSDGFLAAVERHLERHRLLTDRVVVDAPTYVGVAVDATVTVTPGYAASGRTAVAAALDAFLDPLEGFDDEGWPFGRTVYVSELYDVIERVPGIDGVLDVAIRTRGEGRTDDDGNVLLDPASLPDPGGHDIRARTNARRGG
jgi:predicted phage baseplate assembly protein